MAWPLPVRVWARGEELELSSARVVRKGWTGSFTLPEPKYLPYCGVVYLHRRRAVCVAVLRALPPGKRRPAAAFDWYCLPRDAWRIPGGLDAAEVLGFEAAAVHDPAAYLAYMDWLEEHGWPKRLTALKGGTGWTESR